MDDRQGPFRAAASRRGWTLVLALGLGVAARPVVGCGPVGPDDGDPAGPASATLAAIGPEVIVPELARLRADADALVDAIGAWQAARVATIDDTDSLAAARQAWRAVMASCQRLEVMQVGPAAASLTALGGQDLRDAMYAWPSDNRCRVDQETVTGGWVDPAYFDAALVNVQGLAALEVLLFSPSDENGCPLHTEPNESGAWAALGADGVADRRAEHAVALVGRLSAVIDRLALAWSPDGGAFGDQLARRVEGPYGSEAEALQAVYEALFYLETHTKDRKLARPLGLPPCATESCLDGMESPLAGASHLWVAENLRGFRALFTGGAGEGLDDLLEDLGHADLTSAMLAALDEADAAAAALPGPLDFAISTDRAAVEAAHAAIKAVTDQVKLDLTTVLTVQVPAEAAGDND